MKAVVFTLGCKVNEVESASIMSALEKAGLEVDEKLGYADVYILNTCAVTREAERKSRQLISRVKKFNPQSKIFVCGCASEKSGKDFKDRGAHFVCGARDKENILKAVQDFCGIGVPCAAYPKQTKTRAFIKIQDGCNNFCSYCVIPYLRGREVSRPIEEVVDEINATNCPEIVLTGINISSFDKGRGGLAGLIAALKDCKKRIRLGSMECGVIDEKLLATLKSLPDFAPQFHLSLQSGSDKVLKDMNRRYTRAEFLDKCRLIYYYFADAAITTDIIAGFATETEEDFTQSLSIIEEAGFARVHAFAFSPREGTVAFKLKDLPPEIKQNRLKRLIEAGKKSEEKYVTRYLGKTLNFIAEERDGGHTCGYTANYIRVYAKEKLISGKKYDIKLLSLYKDGAEAEIEKN